MKIIDKINEAISQDKTFFSFEYFPPKTDDGVENLYARLDRMSKLNPMFIDVTWGAGGSTADKTIDISTNAQNAIGLETQIHMTCTNMKKEDLKKNIAIAKKNGIQNILALRGDPPLTTQGKWEKVEEGLSYAVDLVKLIREEHGDYFGICVAGYPEGHPDGDYEQDLKHLKAKVDAGAEYVITQLFYDCDKFLKFVKDAKDMGINVPILPGIMPIMSYAGWKRMTAFCKTNIPDYITKEIESLNTDDDEAMKAYGIRLGIQMCKYLMSNGIRGLHFYTLNLEKSVVQILEGLELMPDSVPSPLPWKATANARRQNESVRPIFWAHRPHSYVARTAFWDEYPNGRWGDSRSPAFGEIEAYNILGIASAPTVEKRLQWWGNELDSLESVYQVFVSFLEGKIPKLPWVDREIAEETTEIKGPILGLNQRGFLSVNSQPNINGVPATDKVHGWGPKTEFGFIYKKAYLEFFTSPENLEKIKDKLSQYPNLSLHAVNVRGETFSNTPANHVNAVTWGVFPGMEIIQPTVVDSESFLVWKTEAFALWDQWGHIYDENSKSRQLIQQIHDSWFLVNVVDNNYINGDIFAIFESL
jgi:methylenetetrahydrofolate reductase (NADPH)